MSTDTTTRITVEDAAMRSRQRRAAVDGGAS
jgi:hypothetical protein